MQAILLRLHVDIRARWRAMLLLAVIAGTIGGSSIAAAAGARRTASAYPRFVDVSRATHVSIGLGGVPDPEGTIEAISRAPHVEAFRVFRFFVAKVTLPDGRVVSFPDIFLEAQPVDIDLDRKRVVRGRMPRPDAAAEASTGFAFAERLALEPGDVLDVELRDAAALFGGGEVRTRNLEITLTGIHASPPEFDTLSGNSFNSIIHMSPAFFRAHGDFAAPPDGVDVRVRGGADEVPAFLSWLRGRAIQHDEPILASSTIEGVRQLDSLEVVALWLLAAAIGVCGAAIVAQAIARETSAASTDLPILAALGMTSRQVAAVLSLRGLAVAVVAAAFAVAIATVLSPLAPIGAARIAEPTPGIAFDTVAIGVGAAAVLAAVMVGVLVAAARLVRTGGERTDRPARLPDLLARASTSPASVVGARMAFDAGRGSQAVPVRTAFLGVAVAVAAISMAFVFASSMRSLVASPRLAGYTFDAIAGSFDSSGLDGVERTARRRPEVVRAWRGTVFSLLEVGRGLEVTAFATDRDGPAPAIIEGRAARGADEILLDTKTMRELNKRVGDDLFLPAARKTMKIVGRFAVPRLAFQGQRPDQGASLTFEALKAIDPEAQHEGIFIRYRDGLDAEQQTEALKEALGPGAFVLARRTPAHLRTIGRLASLPLTLAAIVGLMAAMTMAHSLMSSSKRRGRDLAILKTLGFERRHVRAVVAWQASLLTACAAIIGLPVGIALGRAGWHLFGDRIGFVPVAVLPAIAIAALIPAALATANAIASVPARRAARTHPALILRTE